MPFKSSPKIRKSRLLGYTFSGVLTFTLIAAAGSQRAGLAFAQDEPLPVATVRENESGSDVRKSRVLQLPKGSYVEVRLAGGKKIEGRLGDVVDDGFMLQTVSENKLTESLVPFEKMQSVRLLGDSHPRSGTVDVSFDHGKVIMELAAGGVTFGLTVDTDTQDGKKKVTHVSISRNGATNETSSTK